MAARRRIGLGRRLPVVRAPRIVALAASALAVLVGPATAAGAESDRPDIDEIEVSVIADAVVFRIVYAEPVTLPSTAVLDLFIDADDDRTTGEEGFETAVDYSGGALGVAYVSLWHEFEEKRPDGLRFLHDARSSTFTVPVEALGFPTSFDYSFSFYAVIEVDGELADAAPTHVLVSPAAKPFDVEASRLLTHEHVTFDDLADSTPAEDPATLLLVVVAVLGCGAMLALGGWTFERLRRGRGSKVA